MEATQTRPHADAPAGAIFDTTTGIERRMNDRQGAPAVWTSLCSLDGGQTVKCKANNLAEGGLHVTVPVGYGFAVGQRYEVVLHEDQHAPMPTIDEGHYATVVRTEILMEDNGGRIGVGLRFDQPMIL